MSEWYQFDNGNHAPEGQIMKSGGVWALNVDEDALRLYPPQPMFMNTPHFVKAFLRLRNMKEFAETNTRELVLIGKEPFDVFGEGKHRYLFAHTVIYGYHVIGNFAPQWLPYDAVAKVIHIEPYGLKQLQLF